MSSSVRIDWRLKLTARQNVFRPSRGTNSEANCGGLQNPFPQILRRVFPGENSIASISDISKSLEVHAMNSSFTCDLREILNISLPTDMSTFSLNSRSLGNS